MSEKNEIYIKKPFNFCDKLNELLTMLYGAKDWAMSGTMPTAVLLDYIRELRNFANMLENEAEQGFERYVPSPEELRGIGIAHAEKLLSDFIMWFDDEDDESDE